MLAWLRVEESLRPDDYGVRGGEGLVKIVLFFEYFENQAAESK